MVKNKDSYIAKLTLQKVGSKLKQIPNIVTQDELSLNDDERTLLLPFFLNNFKSDGDLMKFTHHIGLEYNPLFASVQSYFKDEISLVELSNNVLHHLYEKSNHPQIKTGELFVVIFNHVTFENISTEAVGIFKVEKKLNFLRFDESAQNIDIKFNKGVSLQKIDKGCLIFNTSASDGYRLFSIDNNSYDASYWTKAFLDIDYVLDDSYRTKNYIHFLENFSNTLAQEDVYKQKEFMGQSIRLLDENEIITKELVDEHLLEPLQIPEQSFETFKQMYQDNFNLEVTSNFSVSKNVLKKERRKIKSEINLDSKIQIKLDINDIESVNENIEKGYDEERRMNFYKVYYHEET